ncbi:MAG: HDOD domain-containing protein [Candidatus Abyssobacteria bacterium SURF_5]|uniref:HDOD domain-containing protein n=1 Tax=Abyssobacteria bacterium (strain SURF_5) TaxID=2093360 RepID=A0A3A4NZN6_ABYX5|nr:MAG: HDOD domain-containing protein [Candidatus Abyssubacteria bacterium SURF_5]
MITGKKKIGALLIERGYVTSEQVRRALEVQKSRRDRLGNILIELGYLSEQKFHEFLGAIGGVASIELARYEISRDIIDLLPRDLALRHEVVPIGRMKSLLTVAMVCPLDEVAIAQLEEATDLKVKPVLCSRSAVYRALDRYYQRGKHLDEKPAEDTVDIETAPDLGWAARLVERVQELPTLPDILQTVSAIVNDPNSSASDLAKVISTDAALSAKILRLANSPAYGFSRKVVDIKHAIALLGFQQTQSLAVTVSIFDYMNKGGGFDFKSYWNHSFACATLAKLLAANLRSHEMESAFVAGLLHDIGKAALATEMFREDHYTGPPRSFPLTSDNEEEVMGITHAELGYLLSEFWLLPETLSHAIRYHHMPEQEPKRGKLPGLIFLANIFCKQEQASDQTAGDIDQRIISIIDHLGLSQAALSQTMNIYKDIATDISLF